MEKVTLNINCFSRHFMLDFNTLDEEVQQNFHKYYECRLYKKWPSTENPNIMQFDYRYYLVPDDEHYLGFSGLEVDDTLP